MNIRKTHTTVGPHNLLLVCLMAAVHVTEEHLIPMQVKQRIMHSVTPVVSSSQYHSNLAH